MSELSPYDCAVAVRSFPRRLREALSRPPEGEDDGSRSREVATGAERLLGLLRQAGSDLHGVLGASVEPEPLQGGTAADAVAAFATRLAERIEAVPADGWTTSALASLRTMVAEGGRILRQIG